VVSVVMFLAGYWFESAWYLCRYLCSSWNLVNLLYASYSFSLAKRALPSRPYLTHNSRTSHWCFICLMLARHPLEAPAGSEGALSSRGARTLAYWPLLGGGSATTLTDPCGLEVARRRTTRAHSTLGRESVFSPCGSASEVTSRFAYELKPQEPAA
jgi:hypothetical protein